MLAGFAHVIAGVAFVTVIDTDFVAVLKFAASAGVAQVIAGVVAVDGVVVKRPRPCVTATSVVPMKKTSSTETFAGPSCGTVHVVPPSSLVKSPTSVAA